MALVKEIVPAGSVASSGVSTTIRSLSGAPVQEVKKENNKSESDSAKGAYKQYFLMVLIAVILLVVIKTYLVNLYVVPTASMSPTIGTDDYIVCVPALYSIGEPKYGDIVVFDNPTDGSTMVKRVIGRPGETIAIDRGTLYIDGDEVREDYITEDWTEWKDDHGEGTIIAYLEDKEYYLMGDNRMDSYDSRYWGPATRDDIKGKVVASFKIDGKFASIFSLLGKSTN